MSKSSKAKAPVKPVIADIEPGDQVVLETSTRFVVRKANGGPDQVIGELTHEEDLSDSVQAFKDTHERQSFLEAADTLETHCRNSIKQTMGKALPFGCSMMSSSLSSPAEDVKKKNKNPI